MEDLRARQLLDAERKRVQALLDETTTAASEDREEALEPGDLTDPAGSLVSEIDHDEVASQLRERLDQIGRAEQRLADGTYGRSVRSGQTIPDERLEADPAAELTVEEAANV